VGYSAYADRFADDPLSALQPGADVLDVDLLRAVA